MFVLLSVGQNDYSNKIHEGTYKVYKENVTIDWEDGNHVLHKEIVRTRTSGSFEMEFMTWSAYETFLTHLTAAKTGAYYALTVYAVNTNESVTGNFFINLPPTLVQKNNLTFTPGSFTLTITEA